MGAREDILGGIRRGLGRGELAGEARAAAEARLRDHPRNLIPQRSLIAAQQRIDLFVRLTEALASTVTRVTTAADVPDAVASYLAQHNLPSKIRMAPDPWLGDLPWADRPLLQIVKGRTDQNDMVTVTRAFAGIAETGTLMLTSGPDTPTTLNFTPDNCIVVLKTSDMVGPIEEGWSKLRAAFGANWPRTVNFVGGPSRTADIEQELIMGAHGPRRLHIVLVDDRAPESA